MSTPETVVTTASPYEGLASNYNGARPSYPDSAIRELAGTTGLVVDIGAGTGIFTRQLAALLPEAEIVGVEPSTDMRSMAHAASNLRNISFMAGSAEKLPFADETVAMITAATAVHWFNRPAFYAEALRCLKPGGRVVVIQNIRRWWDSEWLAAYEALLEAAVEGYTRGTYPAFDGKYRQLDAATELAELDQVSSVTTREVEWHTALAEQDFVSFSLSSTIVQRAVTAIGETAYFERLGHVIGIHSQDGILPIDYVTRVVIATRAGGPAA